MCGACLASVDRCHAEEAAESSHGSLSARWIIIKCLSVLLSGPKHHLNIRILHFGSPGMEGF